jgi:Flp pilus assembly protein TadG
MARRFIGNGRTARSGAAAVEMAIILPFLAFMFAVSADYVRIYYAAQVVNNAARAGALYASKTVSSTSGVTPQQAAQQAAVAEAVSLNPPLQTSNVTVTIGASSASVAVTYQFQPMCPYLGLPAQVPVSATVTMPLSVSAGS